MQNIKKKIKKLSILLLAGLLIYHVLTHSLTNLKPIDPYIQCRSESTSETVDSAEMNDFMAVYKAYMDDRIDAKIGQPISFRAETLDDVLPWNVKFWFFKHCWTPSRFYYVEQRLRRIVQASYTRAHAIGSAEVLERLIAEEGDSLKADAYRNMIETQQKMAEAVAVTDEELAMIAGSEGLLSNLLSQTGSTEK